MKAKVLKPFTMGSTTYGEGRELDLPEDRVRRLSGEGLVSIVEDVAPTLLPPPIEPPRQESPKHPESTKTPEPHPVPKRGGKSRRKKS
jgi:hypothetical protein